MKRLTEEQIARMRRAVLSFAYASHVPREAYAADVSALLAEREVLLAEREVLRAVAKAARASGRVATQHSYGCPGTWDDFDKCFCRESRLQPALDALDAFDDEARKDDRVFLVCGFAGEAHGRLSISLRTIDVTTDGYTNMSCRECGGQMKVI